MDTHKEKNKHSRYSIASFVLSFASPFLVALFFYFSWFPPLYFRIFKSVLMEEGPIFLSDFLFWLFVDGWRGCLIVLGPLMELLALFLGIRALMQKSAKPAFATAGIFISTTVIIFVYYQIFGLTFDF